MDTIRNKTDDYFTNVGTKSALHNQGALDDDEYDSLSLYDSIAKEHNLSLSRYKKANSENYIQWRYLLKISHNIVVLGRGSRYQLIMKFANNIKKYGNSRQTMVMLHGFTPITIGEFELSLGISNGGRSTENNYRDFYKKLQNSEGEYYFILHSFDTLFLKSRQLCEAILNICTSVRSKTRMIMSLDHANSIKFLFPWRNKLNLTIFVSDYRDSYFQEKTQSLSSIQRSNDIQSVLIQKQQDHQSLLDIYQALQKDCRQILIFIFKDYIEQNEANGLDNNVTEIQTLAGATSLKGRSARNYKRKSVKKYVQMYLEFSKLMDHCERNFIVRRANALRAHLGELIDHEIIEMDQSGNRIQCLTRPEVCKKFLEEIVAN